MRTAAEIDAAGRIARLFHRTPTASWTHPPGERYRYRTRTREDGRNVLAWRELRCDCPERHSPVRESADDPEDPARRSLSSRAPTGLPSAVRKAARDG